jgi:hypothetical protein
MHNIAYKIAAVAAALALSFAGTASAQTNWDAMHPHRVEVNHRLARLCNFFSVKTIRRFHGDAQVKRPC